MKRLLGAKLGSSFFSFLQHGFNIALFPSPEYFAPRIWKTAHSKSGPSFVYFCWLIFCSVNVEPTQFVFVFMGIYASGVFVFNSWKQLYEFGPRTGSPNGECFVLGMPPTPSKVEGVLIITPWMGSGAFLLCSLPWYTAPTAGHTGCTRQDHLYSEAVASISFQLFFLWNFSTVFGMDGWFLPSFPFYPFPFSLPFPSPSPPPESTDFALISHWMCYVSKPRNCVTDLKVLPGYFSLNSI